MKLALSFFLTFLLFTSYSQDPDFLNAFSLGGEARGQETSVAIDNQDNIITAGAFDGEVDFDPSASENLITSTGLSSGYVRKLNFDGELQWAGAFFSPTNTFCTDLACDSQGNIYALGLFLDSLDIDPGPAETWIQGFSSQVVSFVVKLNAAGELLWGYSQPLGVNDFARDIAVDNDDNLYVTGQFNYQIDFDPGPDEFFIPSDDINPYTHTFIQKLDPNGNLLWARQIESQPDGENYGRSISILSNNDIVVLGEYTGQLTPDPSDEIGVDAGFAFDIYIIHYNSNGDFISLDILATNENGFDQGFVFDSGVDNQDNLYFTATFDNAVVYNPSAENILIESPEPFGNDILVARINPDGVLDWHRIFSGSGLDYGLNVDVRASNSLLITGYFSTDLNLGEGGNAVGLNSNGNEDVFWAELELDGSLNWAGTAGGPGQDYGNSIVSDSNGKIVAVGSFEEEVDFNPFAGSLNLDAQSQQDGFLLMMNSNFVYTDEHRLDPALGIYPNPGSDKLIIESPDSFNGSDLLISIYNLQGQIVYESLLNRRTEIQVEEWDAGCYQIVVHSTNFRLSKRWLKIQ
ncbi:T9SS type A sorting domain-containing protein [Sanyastnella coralliicola]|uniref:T9SS type A sorting domain-containing protein n=1 Tax=Sanyastnella coralliicola TaxID=3069118 RepID=UPI0027B94EAD|nr:T9SS type A sorting domain-containing protein [Longitalea sp. SCSIO 12813]